MRYWNGTRQTEDSMADTIDSRIDAWLAHCPDPASDPLPGMAEADLLVPAGSYVEIARVKAAMVQRTGVLGVSGAWGGRQLVGRFFVGGFGSDAQRAQWAGRALAVGISEPNVGAHPKLLSTRAEISGDQVRITGEKAWVSNAPTADAIIVFAITSEDEGRKRYSAFIVPRDTPGLTLKEMPGFHALRPSRHCGVVLDGCVVPLSARLGAAGVAYDRMALPLRDLEDAVGTFGALGAFRWLLSRLGRETEDAVQSLGALVALTSVFTAAAESEVAALDAGTFRDGSAVLVGLRVLGAEIRARVRAHIAAFGPHGAAAVDALLADLDASENVARGPRMARQVRLGKNWPAAR